VVATANTLTFEEPPAALGGVIVASRSAAASGAARSASGLANERAAPEAVRLAPASLPSIRR